MKTHRYFTNMTVALVSAVLATLLLIACQQSQQQPSPAAVESKVASTEKFFVQFQGPWAFVTDPKDANSVLAIAPKHKGHRDLYALASNHSRLDAGVYELSLAAHSGNAAATADPSIVQAKIDAQSLQRALDNKSARYVIRLPKPEEYVVGERHRSRVGATYPPDVATEKDYATAVSLRYNVTSLNGFSLAGTPDSGTFNPLLLQVETPLVRFHIAPAQDDDPHDKCDTHSRESFQHLTALLNLTLFVDFPDNPADCHKNDVQNAHPAKAEADSNSRSRVELSDALWIGTLAPQSAVRLAGVDLSAAGSGFLAAPDANVRSYQAAFVLLFGLPIADCNAPHIILTLTPTP